MTPRIYTALIVYFGSYFPLSIILLVLNFDTALFNERFCLNIRQENCALPFKTPFLAIGIFLLCGICFLLSLYVLSLVEEKDHPIEIKESRHVPSELMSYVLPYIVSFMSIDYQDTSKLIGILIFLIWMFWITYKSEQIIMNPMLTVFGWKLYDIKYVHQNNKKSYQGKLLSKVEMLPGQSSLIGQFQDTMIIKPKK